MKKTKEIIYDKIKKLLAVAEDKSISKEEASVFAAKAYKMMIENKIERSELNIFEENEIIISKTPLNKEDMYKKAVAPWKQLIGKHLCDYFGCFITKYSSRMVITGKKKDIDSVQYLYDFCRNSIDELTAKHAHGFGRMYAISFREGCVYSIILAMRKEKEEMMAEKSNSYDSLALAILSPEKEVEQCQQKFEELTKVKLKEGKPFNRDNRLDDAFRDGLEKGKDIYKPNRNTLEKKEYLETGGSHE